MREVKIEAHTLFIRDKLQKSNFFGLQLLDHCNYLTSRGKFQRKNECKFTTGKSRVEQEERLEQETKKPCQSEVVEMCDPAFRQER